MFYYIYWVVCVKPFILAFWNKTSLAMLFDLFSVVLTLFCKYFIEIICVHVPWGNCSMVFIFDYALIYVAYQSNLTS